MAKNFGDKLGDVWDLVYKRGFYKLLGKQRVFDDFPVLCASKKCCTKC
ncbi:MAG: hypothetical protein IPM82_23795 [Saprospiraceae bacterium]|nr:hypothetical protein [Saprospiraceae bacterium]